MIVRILYQQNEGEQSANTTKYALDGNKIRKGASKCETVGEMQSSYKQQQGSDSMKIHRADMSKQSLILTHNFGFLQTLVNYYCNHVTRQLTSTKDEKLNSHCIK